MRLRLLPDGNISFTHIDALEASALLAIPANADASEVPEALERLFPPPIQPNDEAAIDPMEQAAAQSDWEEFVTPELEEIFEGAVQRVQKNLQTLSPAPCEESESASLEDSPLPNFALLIPRELAEDWYRAMNQSRLVMAQKTLWIDAEGDLHGPLLSQIQYEIYTSIQQWLVEHVLSEA